MLKLGMNRTFALSVKPMLKHSDGLTLSYPFFR